MTPKNYSQKKKKKKDTQKLISGVLSHSPKAPPHALSSPHQPPTGLAGGPLPTTSYWFKPDLSSNIYPYSVPYFFSGSLLFVCKAQKSSRQPKTKIKEVRKIIYINGNQRRRNTKRSLEAPGDWLQKLFSE